MKLEIISTGKTVEEAIDAGCKELGVERDVIEFEIIERPKKAFLGLKVIPAKVKVSVVQTKANVARDYIAGILEKMGLNIEIETEDTEDSIVLSLKGEGLGVVIGRRGETLDSLQYLASLVANREGGSYKRVSIDIGDYRKKREETLNALAKKLAAQAVKTGRSVTLEPMNPYERRVIHSAVQEVEGATSRSIGEEPNRRIIISSTAAPKKSYNGKKSGYGRKSGNYNRKYADKATAGAEAAENEPGAENGTSEENKRNGERREYNRSERRDGRRGQRRGPKPEQPVSTRPAEVKEEAKDKPLYGKIEL